MKINLFWFCICLTLNKVLTFELKDCSDSNDKVLVAESQSNTRIGCKKNYSIIKSCSITKRGNPEIRCSNSECHSSDKIRFTGDFSKSTCEFEFQNVVSQGEFL